MRNSVRQPDFAHFGEVVLAWRTDHGLSQADVARRDGPSDTTQTLIESGHWSSARPGQTLIKVDRGLGWKPGVARRVLFDGFDPLSAKVDDVVGGGTQDQPGYVESPGDRASGGLADDAVLRKFDEMSEAIREMSERLARLEKDGRS